MRTREPVVITESGDLDERTVAYILATRKPFEDLRQVAAQLAGLLVLAAAGAKSGTPEHPMLEAAGELYRAAAEGVRSARPTERARAHHRHVERAVEALGSALTRAREEVRVEPVLAPLKRAYGELRAAAKELPGFQMISFEQGCCAGVPQ